VGRVGWETRILSGVDHHAMLRDPTACRDAIVAFARKTSAARTSLA
jgi:hypothetical protein